MKFPYGLCDFHALITEDYFYLDRTDYIPVVEQLGKHLLFLRPRRFGKSLWLSTLENYYDVAKAEEFESLFGHLAIGQNPTPLHNRYFMMKWDFSMVDPSGDTDHIRKALYDHINGAIEQFCVHYRDWLDYDVRLGSNAIRSFQSLLAAIRTTPYRLYLLIDEYDNFANEVLMTAASFPPAEAPNEARYATLVQGEGIVKTVFKAIKASAAGMGLDRTFITGVSPIVLSDITSGYNIAKSISQKSELHDLCGFQEAEIAPVLARIADECDQPADKGEALALLRALYNGYRFVEDAALPVYNPTLVLYFLDEFARYCRYPQEPLDVNLATDRAKLAYIAGLPQGGQLLLDALSDADAVSVSSLAAHFGVSDVLHAAGHAKGKPGAEDTHYMAALLYYLGMLTLAGRTSFGKVRLEIPNLVSRQLYAERIQDLLLPDISPDTITQLAETCYQDGDLGPLCEFVEQRYFKAFDNRDYRWMNELTVKTAFLSLLFNDNLYLVDSEPAIGREYADLLLLVRPDMRQYQIFDLLLEFKYVSLKEANLDGATAHALSLAELRTLAPVVARLAEARAQLAQYRATLAARYGEQLRLRTYAVVALGFERLVLEEMKI